ncbi:hypothetical protein [Geomonas anaerohicana]|uniref:Uncharacterized protein n=1 Tax=Geomonas anaerohicana TaxID=2798583 RepID=A0ABS0YFH4_9BACT|nr:hypothetical protein [Geomonas anaerohicana]MBJ6751078.1 hypothetical protein [Geomonas anaerohicana]
MKRCTLMLALLLTAAAAHAEMKPAGSPATTTDLVALNLCEELPHVAQGADVREALAVKQQGFNQLEGTPLATEELNAVHGRYLLGGVPLQSSLQLSDVKLWDEGRGVAKPQQMH